MLKRFLIVFIGFILVVAVLGFVKFTQIQEMSSMDNTPPPASVTTAEARVDTWHPVIRAIGTLAPIQGVTVSADSDGTVVRIAVENGANVQAGDLLVEIDTSVEQAQLEAAKAREVLAGIQRERTSELLGRNTVSQAEFDTAAAQHNQAVAEVAGLEALIERKRVRAPFAGRVGIRLINEGQYIGRGQALMSLQQADPMYVNFFVPQRQLPSLGIGQRVDLTIDAFPGRTFEGSLSAINTEVDAATRNIATQATVANPGEQLRAGMFVQVEVTLPEAERVVVVPATAIAYASYGNAVYVVETMTDAEGRSYLGVRQQPVRLGTTRGDLVVVEEGLQGGEQIATAGVFKLRNGLPVQVNNEALPGSNPAPQPGNS